jgi:AsmA protein
MVEAGIITHVIGGIGALLSYDRASDLYGLSMRTAKILATLVGGIIALLVAGLLAVWLWVNPNDYKARISAGVKEATGRELALAGDLKLSLFPWVALELGPGTLENPPGFGGEPFLAFKGASVRVRLFPLLVKQLDMERVELQGLDVRLRRDAEGRGNWENFGRRREAAAAADVAAAEAGGEGKGSDGLSQLPGIRVTGGRVTYPGLVLQNLTLDTGAMVEHGATAISLTFDANRDEPRKAVSVNAKFALSADSPGQRLRLAAVNVVGLLENLGDGRPARWEMSAPAIDVDIDGQTLAVPAFALSYSNARLTGKLLATKILDDLGVTGSAMLAPMDLREFAPRRIALPKTRDPKVFAQLSAGSDFAYDAAGWRLDHLQLQLDDTHLTGNAALAGEPRALKFDVVADQVDVDRYRAEEGSAAPAAEARTASTGKDTAHPLDASGTLSVGSAHFAGMDFTQVRVTLAFTDHVMHFFPAQAQIDGGRYSGDITVDRRGAVPALSLDEHFMGIDVSRLLANGAYQGRLSGRGNMELKATAKGAGIAPMLQSLNGHFDAYLTAGAVEGVDVGYELARAQAVINRQSAPSRENTHHTPFDACKMSAEIVDGLAKTSDLAISSQVVRVSGQGSANLPSKAIDLQLTASVLKSPGATLADIPLKITGTYDDPTVKADVDSLVKGQLKQKLQDVLKKNGLEGLFGK